MSSEFRVLRPHERGTKTHMNSIMVTTVLLQNFLGVWTGFGAQTRIQSSISDPSGPQKPPTSRQDRSVNSFSLPFGTSAPGRRRFHRVPLSSSISSSSTGWGGPGRPDWIPGVLGCTRKHLSPQSQKFVDVWRGGRG